MHCACVGRIPLIFGVDALLLDKHLGTHGLGFVFEAIPTTSFQSSHSLTFFKTQHSLAQHLWHWHRGFAVGVGIHVKQFASDQQLIATKYPAHKLN